MHPFYRGLKLGILGGGQLGRMLIQSAVDFNVHIGILDPSAEAPCKPYAHEFTQGSLTDYDTVYAFGKNYDVLSIEIENVNTEALEALQAEGKQVYPDPKTIRMIQNKVKQKQFYEKHNIPTSAFYTVENKEDVISHAALFPMVQKTAEAGYDGRGVQILRSEADLDKAFDAPGMLEELVDIDKEIAVLAARNPKGEMAIFSLVEMVFDPVHNLVDYLLAPARITESQKEKALQISRDLLSRLSYVGIMAIEMFVTKSGEILVNEVAPRPHNSGHHTIRACMTSQYEQHLRAILGLPLGNPEQICPAAMVNMLGAAGHQGPAIYKNIDQILKIPGVFPHIYGKAMTKPQRKMGHITILDKNKELLLEKIEMVKGLIDVVSE
ncbi:MAG: 5-(carboxyamino)imidazole ribonucleotide synthase [Bacteroidetes bacterium]|nr:5-(carboxyamino)imidazole ribonucleotide synthase [Bacteroidota bacterium]